MNSYNNLAYYEKLGFDDVTRWSKEDLLRFLVQDYIDAFNENLHSKDVGRIFLDGLKRKVKNYKKSRYVTSILDTFFLALYTASRSKKKKMLFQDSKHAAIILGSRKKYHIGLVAQGKQDRLFALQNCLGYINANDLDQYVVSYLESEDMAYLYQLVQAAEAKLKAHQPDYFVMRDDFSPTGRALVLAAKKLGITTVAMQGGLFDSHLPLFICKMADAVLVWGQFVKDMFVNQSARQPQDLYVIGYPHVAQKEILSPYLKRGCYMVCYLSQYLEEYNRDFLSIKLKTIESLSAVCKKLGLGFVYRPHPSENRLSSQQHFPEVLFTQKHETLRQTLGKADIFIGLSSTALVEASMASKISLQLIDYPVATDNFETLGVCEKSFNDIKDLEAYLGTISNAPDLLQFKANFNNEFVETRFDPSRRFLEILEEIENKKTHHAA